MNQRDNLVFALLLAFGAGMVLGNGAHWPTWMAAVVFATFAVGAIIQAWLVLHPKDRQDAS